MASLLKYLDNDMTLSRMSEIIYLKSQEPFRPRSYLGSRALLKGKYTDTAGGHAPALRILRGLADD